MSGLLGALLVAALKATVLLSAAGLAAILLRRRSAAVRHAVWLAALAGALVLPVLATIGPTWRVAWLPVPDASVKAEKFAPALRDETAEVLAPIQERADAGAQRRSGTAYEMRTEQGATVEAASPALPDAAPARGQMSWRALAFALWLAGAGAWLSWILLGLLQLRRQTRTSVPMEDVAWQQLLRRCAAELQLERRVTLRRAYGTAMPMTYGLLRPVVLLPEAAEAWPADRRRVVLLHELAHVQRGDCATQLLASFACVLYWFNPLVWYAARRLRVERERACDDRVLAAGEPACDYADHLLDIARTYRPSGALAAAAVAMARPSQLEGRLLAILNAARPRQRLTARSVRLLIAASAALLLPLAAIRGEAAKYDAPSPSENSTRDASWPGSAAAAEFGPDDVVRHPDPNAALEARWRWSMREASRRGDGDVFWVGYAIARAEEPGETILEGSHGIDLDALGSTPLARIVYQAGESPQPGEVGILLRFTDGRLDRVSVLSMSVGANLRGRTLYWLHRAEHDEGYQLMRRLERWPVTAEARPGLVSAIAVHRRSALVFPYLSELLRGSEAANLRAQAAEGLAYHSTTESLRLLVNAAYRDRDARVRREAAEAIGGLRVAEATAALAALVRDAEDVTVRVEAAEALGARPANEALPVLEQIVRTHPDAQVRAEAVEAIGDLRDRTDNPTDPGARADLLVWLAFEDGASHLRREATETLAQLPVDLALPRLVRIAWESPDASVARQAAEALGRVHDERAVAALDSIAHTHADASVQRQAAEALENFAPHAAVPRLRRIAWTHPRADVQRQAVEALGRFSGAVALLDSIVFSHPNWGTRSQALEALGQIGTPAALAILRRVAEQHPDARLREDARGELDDRAGDADIDVDLDLSFDRGRDDPTGERLPMENTTIQFVITGRQRIAPEDEKAFQALRANLDHQPKHDADLVRERSIWAMSRIRDGRIVQPIIDALADDDWRVRAYAAWALGVTHDPRGVQPLARALDDSHWRVRMHAVGALRDMDRGGSVAQVTPLLQDEHWQVRIAAISYLAEQTLGDDRALAPLQDLLRREQHGITRDAAAVALRRLTAAAR